jgi:hypothetical protein
MIIAQRLSAQESIARKLTFVGLEVQSTLYYQSKPDTYTALQIPPFSASQPLDYIGPSHFEVFKAVQDGLQKKYESVGSLDLSHAAISLILVSEINTKIKLKALDMDWDKFPPGSYRVYNQMDVPLGIIIGDSKALIEPKKMIQNLIPETDHAQITVFRAVEGKPKLIIKNVLLFSKNQRVTVFVIQSRSDYFGFLDTLGNKVKGDDYHLVRVNDSAPDYKPSNTKSPL